jgi:methionine-rich copper-binding protein CopC
MLLKEVKPGFEKEAELLLQKKEVLEKEKEKAIAEAIAKVELEFSEREKTIFSILELITEQVEVPDPEEEVKEEDTDEESSSETTVADLPVEEPTVTVGEPISPSQIKFN